MCISSDAAATAAAAVDRGEDHERDPRRDRPPGPGHAASPPPRDDRRRPSTAPKTSNAPSAASANQIPRDTPGSIRSAGRSYPGRDRIRLTEPARVDRQVVLQLRRLLVDPHVRQPHPVGRQPLHAAVGPEIGQERCRCHVADLLDQPLLTGIAVRRHGLRKRRRPLLRQEEHVGLDHLGGLPTERQDAERHPRVRGRDLDVDRGALPSTDALLLRALVVEPGRQEDGTPGGVEVEHLRRIGWQEVAVVPRPSTDRIAATLEHRDVERIDLGREEHLRRGRQRGRSVLREEQ